MQGQQPPSHGGKRFSPNWISRAQFASRQVERLVFQVAHDSLNATGRHSRLRTNKPGFQRRSPVVKFRLGILLNTVEIVDCSALEVKSDSNGLQKSPPALKLA
jgi:hypothetical protein